MQSNLCRGGTSGPLENGVASKTLTLSFAREKIRRNVYGARDTLIAVTRMKFARTCIALAALPPSPRLTMDRGSLNPRQSL
jgi:hypothetical protein